MRYHTALMETFLRTLIGSGIGRHQGTRWLSVVSALEAAVRSEEVRHGERLPSQHLLADFMDVHVNTVNRPGAGWSAPERAGAQRSLPVHRIHSQPPPTNRGNYAVKNSKLNSGITKLALGASLCASLAACGGGSDGNPSASSAAQTVTTSGTAAIGAPIVGGAVSLKCASGATATATTGSDGSWNVSLKSTDYPCAVRVSDGQANGTALASPLHSVAAASGTTNITPLTDIMVGVLGNQDPEAWFSSVKSGDLATAITSGNLTAALTKLTNALATLPGKPALPVDFNPLTTSFKAEKGDAGDNLLESYGAALTASGLSQSDAAVDTANGTALTQSAYTATAFTTPYVSFTAGWSKNLDGKTVLSIPDPLRGASTAEVNVDATSGNFTLAGSSPFTDLVSLLGNRVGTVCVASQGQASNTQHSLYIYVSPDFTEVTDTAEIKSALVSNTFDSYEDCTKDSIAYAATATGLTATYSDGSSDAVADAEFTENGDVEARQTNGGSPLGTAVSRIRLYKYTDPASSKTTYAIVETSSDQDTTDLAYDPTKDLNNIILSVSR